MNEYGGEREREKKMDLKLVYIPEKLEVSI
jgi:hypothetical protein